MKTQPIEPASIDWGVDAASPPRSPRYDDLYHPRIGALAQARHVFLDGNRLPARWAGRDDFVILETGFGLGNNFLAVWQAWREDPARCRRLHVVSIERHPLRRDDLERAHAASPLPGLARRLLQAWPALTPNLHALDFDEGRVSLLLAFGDVADLLPGLRVVADAFFLDGFAPARNPRMWQPRVIAALGRKAAPGATLATWSVARDLRAGLATAGFEVQLAAGIGGKREITVAHWLPRFVPRALPAATVSDAREAIVVGAGLAGAAVAQALAQLGLQVTVVEAQPQAATQASGNPAGLFHGTVHGADGAYARLFRAAALQAGRVYAVAIESGDAIGSVQGLLRLAPPPNDLQAMAALLAAQRLPHDYLRAVDAAGASSLAGVALAHAAWSYAGGGWLAPAQWVRSTLERIGVRWLAGVQVAQIARAGDDWQVLNAGDAVIARAPLLVLANAGGAQALLQTLGYAPWPLQHTRGQVTRVPGATALRMPVAGDGYAIPLADGLVCGATREIGEPNDDDAPRAADDAINLERLQRLTGLRPPTQGTVQGRVGWRLNADDRMPIAGAVPALLLPAAQRRDQARLLRREKGLFVLTALGARGLTLAPLLARLVAAQATGTPWPLEQDLADAVDPARWIVRAARGANGGSSGQPG